MRKWVLVREDPSTGKLEYMTTMYYGGFSSNIFDAAQTTEERYLKGGLTKAKKRHGFGKIWDVSTGAYIPDPTPWEYYLMEVETKMDLNLSSKVKL